MAPKTTQAAPNPFRSARRAGVPIVAIESADPAATIVQCAKALNGSHDSTPQIRWDIVRGLIALNTLGGHVLSHFADELPLNSPANCLATLVSKSDKLSVMPESELEKPEDKRRAVAGILYMVHSNRWLEDTECMQAVWNARDAFEPIGFTLVLIGPSIKLPVELKNDVVIISEPLPGHEELGKILDHIADDAQLTEEKIGDRDIVIDTMSGTSAFGAKQILAMSVTKDGINRDTLWNRQKKMIEQTKGLSVWRGGETFEMLGGLWAIKDYLTRIVTSGKTPVDCVLWADEVEKQIAGAQGDMSGTSQDQLGALLRFLQDFNIPAMLLLGHPGTGKSAIAKATGNIAGRPVLGMDMGAMKGSLVGQSEEQIRAALEVAVSVSAGKLIMIMTCNKLAGIPPEFRRRCTLGTWFFPLPDKEERAAIWPHWIDYYELQKRQALPDDDGFTGAEIKACCDVAYRTELSLKEASKYIVPIVKSAPEQIAELCRMANNRFLSASAPGVYRYQDPSLAPTKEAGKRQIQI
jgi:hypothetical protein